MKYVLDTPTKGIKMEPFMKDKELWNLEIFSDSDFSGDKDTRISISGHILYVCGVPISWRSKAQKSVSLSSTEAEWYACSEAVKEIMFAAQLLESLKIKVKYPLKVRVDNIGAIYMTEKESVSNSTKHISTRTYFVKEFVRDGVVEIVFVKGEKNISDLFTKNVNGVIYDEHTKEFMMSESEIGVFAQNQTGRMLEDVFGPEQKGGHKKGARTWKRDTLTSDQEIIGGTNEKGV
jgi:hypothetical protein